jgi:hypothetical protein
MPSDKLMFGGPVRGGTSPVVSQPCRHATFQGQRAGIDVPGNTPSTSSNGVR